MLSHIWPLLLIAFIVIAGNIASRLFGAIVRAASGTMSAAVNAVETRESVRAQVRELVESQTHPIADAPVETTVRKRKQSASPPPAPKKTAAHHAPLGAALPPLAPRKRMHALAAQPSVAPYAPLPPLSPLAAREVRKSAWL